MSDTKQKAYRVLARKYRPLNFDQLIGQEALVRTLKNAIESGRIAQAYMLTGIRGTGKTTTARIIAKALNYKGPDGTSGPTTGSTDDCDLCKAITDDRHPDVMEMDAASRTGVEDIREILDGVRYAPTSARYKVYIIDEIHMLSKAAFNALLKTLEEPPEHVIFIFATTEIRKVPVTVLSRCQRFDLRRVDVSTLADYYKEICNKEGVTTEDEALQLIARAADGSVRDGLSLLDQSIALSNGTIETEQIQDMLGLADRSKILDVLEHSLKGECAEALDILENLYKAGADPATLVKDMLDYAHLMTKSKAAPKASDTNAAMSASMIERLGSLASELSMPTLGRTWQILLKGLEEMKLAPNQQAAAEMIIIRLSYAADLPDPASLIKKLQNGEAVAVNTAAPPSSDGAGSSTSGAVPTSAPAPAMTHAADQPHSQGQNASVPEQAHSSPTAQGIASTATAKASMSGTGNVQAMTKIEPVIIEELINEAELITSPQSLRELEQLLKQSGEVRLAGEVFQSVHLVRIEAGKLEIRPEPGARKELASELARVLKERTDEHWMVMISSEQGSATLAEQAVIREQQTIEQIKQDPLIQNIVELFPGTEVKLRQPE